MTSLQYLIDQGVIKVNTPINSVLATDVSIPVDKQTNSFVVKVTSEHYELNEIYYTFAQFFNQNDASGSPRGTLVGVPQSPEFILGSLPSEDKKQLYEYIEKTLNPGSQVELLEIDFEISLLALNGSTIQSWIYDDCTLLDYVVFLSFDKDEYRWGQGDEKEIRELFAFQCKGLDFKA